MRRGIENAAGVRLTERDKAALQFVADVGAVRQDDLTILLGLYSAHGSVGARTGRAVVARWVRAGLASSEQILSGVPSIVEVTAPGQIFLGLKPRRGGVPWMQLPHTLTASALGIGFLRAGQTFIGERALERQPGGWQPGQHRPDGMLRLPEGRVAIEVECTTKSRHRWEDIVPDLLQHYDAVQYWTTPEVARALQQWAQGSLTEGDRSRLIIRDLNGWQR